HRALSEHKTISISWSHHHRTINDYGALTPKMTGVME
ncbi:TPA: hypothetical protein ACIX7T_005055, partial [Escherichia coli]